jgi:hypothetical protein
MSIFKKKNQRYLPRATAESNSLKVTKIYLRCFRIFFFLLRTIFFMISNFLNIIPDLESTQSSTRAKNNPRRLHTKLIDIFVKK